MNMSRFFSADRSRPPAGIIVRDVVLIFLLCLALIGILAHAPSNTYSYAQFWQIQVSIDQVNGGSLLLPRINTETDADGNYRNYARKPQLFAWLLTAAMKLTGLNNEIIYRVPTIIAFLGIAALTYLLGVRWYGRAAGLAAAAMLVTCLHMNKLAFLATTDMLLTFLVTLCIFCADRITFHPPADGRRTGWRIAFWCAMLLAALAKGWGIVNLALLGGFLLLAGGFGLGFRAAAGSAGNRWTPEIIMVVRRWRAVIRSVRLFRGLLLMAVVLIPLWIAMLEVGGEAFKKTVYFEIVQRITGVGRHAPHEAGGPMAAHLFYNLLPLSIFATAGLLLVRAGKTRRVGLLEEWLRRSRGMLSKVLAGIQLVVMRVAGWCAAALYYRSPTALPLWWVLTVLIAFGIPAGFRPDYLLPCYPAAALLGGWAAVELSRPERYAAGTGWHLARICRFVPFVPAAGVILVAVAYLSAGGSPSWLPEPARVAGSTWYLLAVVLAGGIVAVILAVAGTVRKHMGLAVAATCLAMLGMMFCYTHFFRRQARYGDGDTICRFAGRISAVIGDDDFVMYGADKIGLEAYLGRFGRRAQGLGTAALLEGGERWLLTTDRGLLGLGAYRKDPAGPYEIDLQTGDRRFRTRPGELGTVRAASDRPLAFEDWGKIYLVRLRPPFDVSSEPLVVGYIPDDAR